MTDVSVTVSNLKNTIMDVFDNELQPDWSNTSRIKRIYDIKVSDFASQKICPHN